jgi:hypothetical protein
VKTSAGSNPIFRPTKVSESIDDVVAYTNLTDGIFDRILRPADPKVLDYASMFKAHALLKRIDDRDHYRFVGAAMAPQREKNGVWTPVKQFEETYENEVRLAIEISKQSNGRQLSEKDIRVNIVNFNYGKKAKNPVDDVYFFNKGNLKFAQKLPKAKVSDMLPSVFYEQHVRVYSRLRKDEAVVKKSFRRWCKMQKHTIIKDFSAEQDDAEAEDDDDDDEEDED